MFTFATQPLRIPQILKESLKLYRASIRQLWYWALLISVISSVLNTFFPVYIPEHGFSVLGLILMLVDFLASIFVLIIMIHRAQAVGMQQRVSLIDSLKLARKKLLITFAAFIIVTIIVILTSFAFIIPGIYFFIMFVFYSPAIVIDNTGVFPSMKQSIQLVHKNWFRTFTLFLIPFLVSVVLLSLLGLISEALWYTVLISVVFGMIFMPYYTTTLLVQYNDLKLRRELNPPSKSRPSRRK
jgi:hypothetical protein